MRTAVLLLLLVVSAAFLSTVEGAPTVQVTHIKLLQVLISLFHQTTKHLSDFRTAPSVAGGLEAAAAS